MEVYSYFSLKLPKWSMYIWKHYLDAQSFNLWQSSSKLDSVFINLNFSSRGGHSQTVVNTTAKKFWKTWTVTHLLKVRQNSGCIAGNDGWQFLYQKGHDNMLVDRGWRPCLKHDVGSHLVAMECDVLPWRHNAAFGVTGQPSTLLSAKLHPRSGHYHKL